MSIDVSAIKEGQKKMWAVGDYPDLAHTIQGVADVLVERIGVREGESLLDVATGSGNVAIPAALKGARVTGLDLTPELLEAARKRAGESGVDIRFIEGDAEELPFEDGSFDRVASCFGVIFAPRHSQAAAELARVARAGGEVAFTAWTPEGMNGRMFRTFAGYMPPPPAGIESPLRWGEEDHVRSLFEHTGARLEFERRTVTVKHDSPESWVSYTERVLGPTIMAKAALEPQGRWQECRSELVALYTEHNEATDGSFSAPAEYLLTLAQMPS
jgi:SAM-dependent methyltransferase